ncbi:uncharacterized protein MYCFIDRAFT_185895 [Pseudocercospora fijiensis CIRAD86]|uniref:Major facilitator superfamily (MFS) profile domain-containing protein n=1 Tax=Pseudocercospora fijiensis (strain CIRAD86) TaxID=383855 RepID=N1QCU8_PSEFD|nr:uncharacterized protein MYCFIDRAFT_185895 [Pseudocercospora fijiensis CIRAD86]EME89697.1 hypothetical protein MYCFIDRAFT_185895 [Pseudocercospora fijiensis CIRAD86]
MAQPRNEDIVQLELGNQKANDVHAETIEAIDATEGGRDKAAELLKKAGHSVVVTPEENKRILSLIDWHILPIILFIYCLQSLDKTALSYASVFGIIEDLNLVGQEYSWSGAIVYVAQLVWQPIVAYFLVKLPLGKFCATMVFCWGATLCGMVASKNFGGLMASRFVLGSFEASVAPTFIALPRQTIFLFYGLLTVAFSFVVFIWLPDSLMQARFLKGDDKLMAIERLRINQIGISSGIWFCMLTAVSIPSGRISTFGPLIVKSFGFDSFTTILFNMPFGASPVLAALCIPPIIGISLLLKIEHTEGNKGVLLFAYYMTSVYPAISPMIYSWSGQNTAGDTKRKMTTAILFIGASAGNILGPNLYRADEKPRYTRGLAANLALFIAIIVFVGVGAFYITILNKKHAAARQRMGKSAEVVDLSMQSASTLTHSQKIVNDTDGAGVGDRAFDDLTDLKNEDFIYVH